MTDGTVYLICFDRKIGDPGNTRSQAKHYIGWTDRTVDERLADHLAGKGAKIMAEVARLGIPVTVVREWEGDRHLERKLKNRKNAPKLCPICSGKNSDVLSQTG